MEPYTTTQYGTFQYRVPSGWFDASGDSTHGRYLIWFVREDYGATIGLQEIFLDNFTQLQVNGGGMRAIAELSRELAARESGRICCTPVEEFTLQGILCYSYEHAGRDLPDAVRVVVFEAGGKVYELTALAVADGADSAAVFSVQQDVLTTLRRPSL